jgi:hypothetical protein
MVVAGLRPLAELERLHTAVVVVTPADSVEAVATSLEVEAVVIAAAAEGDTAVAEAAVTAAVVAADTVADITKAIVV